MVTWFFDTKQACVVQQLTVLNALSLSRQARCFESDIQPELVPEFEAVHHGARGAVDLDGHATNAMHFQPLRESLWVEAVYGDGNRQLDAVVTASRHGQVDGRWDLRRDAVVRECADQADRRLGRSCRYYGEIGMLGFPGLGQTMEAAAEFDDLTAIPQGIESVGMHPECDQVSSAERAVLVAEGLQCGLKIAGFHLGNNRTTYV